VFNLKKRIKKIFSNASESVDSIVIKNSSEPYIDENFFYITELEQGLFEECCAVLYPDGNVNIIVSELESESAKKSGKNVEVYRKKEEFYNILKKNLKSSKNIGLNFNGMLLKDFLKLENKISNKNFVNVSSSIMKTRIIKDNFEIKKIKKATEIVDKVMSAVPSILHKGIFEYELAAEINNLIQKNGADGIAFDTISSFGKNTAEPHYSHGEIKLKNGDFVLCDFGARYKRYNSDITRTFVFGKATEKQKRIHNTVLKAQQIGFSKIKAGIEAHVVHDSVNKFINKSEFKGRFIHSTGHSLGLKVHDGGVAFNEESKIILKENMVLTVEPGIYIPGLSGVRIEDDIIVKENGLEILTKSPRKLIEI
jgi:Xaa-Pro dipeptidase